MGDTDYDDIINGRLNVYESTFFHIYLNGESPIGQFDNNEVTEKDYASFLHEYIHYLQQITTPYGIKHNNYFTYNLILFREHIEANQTISVPIDLPKINQAIEQYKLHLEKKFGSKTFNLCNIGDVEIDLDDLFSAKKDNTAVSVGVYDYDNQRVFKNGFSFGYVCVMESMAHMIQSLVNPELYHADVPYQSARLICDRLYPEANIDDKLLISVCYTALFFDNPGLAFFEILRDLKENENGLDLYKRYMIDYSRTFQGEEMPNYRMMHAIMDNLIQNLHNLLGDNSIYYKNVIENCKLEASRGKSLLLDLIYKEDMKDKKVINDLLNFYGYPAIDSKNSEVIVPINPDTMKPYIETGCLLSLELIYSRFTTKGDTGCKRFSICDRNSRVSGKDLIEDNCMDEQWEKQIDCLFKNGLSYWRMATKSFIQN